MVQTWVTLPWPNSVGNALRGVPLPMWYTSHNRMARRTRNGTESVPYRGNRRIATLTADELNHAGRRSVSGDVSPVHTMACAALTAIPRSCCNLREFALVFVNLREIALICVDLR
jgi:hypothetical protein